MPRAHYRLAAPILAVFCWLSAQTLADPLYAAAAKGDAQAVAALIAKKTEVDTSVWGIAAANGHDAVLATLLRLDPGSLEDGGFDALEQAARNGQSRIIDMLLKAGFDINYKGGYSGGTALHDEAPYGNLSGVRALLAAGINPRLLDDRGRSALFGVQDAGIAALLISVGVDVNQRDIEGKTPLLSLLADQYWREDQEPPSLAVLIKAGADVNAADKLGRTALAHRGTRFDTNRDLIAKRLIRAGGKPGNDCDGWTRYQDAVVTRNAAVEKWSAEVDAFNAEVSGMSRSEYRERREIIEDRRRALDLDNWPGFRSLRGFVNLSKSQREEFHRFCNQSTGSDTFDLY